MERARIRQVTIGPARIALIGLLLSFGPGARPITAAPTTMTYQGRLSSPSGTPHTGLFNMTFRICPAPTGGTPLWEETFNNLSGQVDVDGYGLFEVFLGNQTPITPALFPLSAPERYLEIEVNGEVLSPRRPLNGVPHAFTAAGNELWQTDGTNVSRASGNVGVGIATPIQRLEVSGSIEATGQGGLPSAYLRLVPSPGGGEATAVQTGGNTPATDIAFRPGGIEALRMTTNGRLGIGTNTPTDPLHVTGVIHSSSGGFKFPDGSVQTTAADAFGGLGPWLGRSPNTTYQALSDGFVIAVLQANDPGTQSYARGFSDDFSSPTSVRSQCSVTLPGSGQADHTMPYASFVMPVRKNAFWKVTQATPFGSAGLDLYFISLGP